MAVFSRDQSVLKPKEVVDLLVKKKGLNNQSRMCRTQPLQVEHHCSFIVDLEALQNAADVKCDDMGAWKNNSSHKYYFQFSHASDNADNDSDDDHDDNGNDVTTIVPTKDPNTKNGITLKREYFALRHDFHNDFRKRTDTILRECILIYDILEKFIAEQQSNSLLDFQKQFIYAFHLLCF